MTTAAERIASILKADEFDDQVKLEQLQDGRYYDPSFVRFCLKQAAAVERLIKGGVPVSVMRTRNGLDDTARWLDIGCGTGEAFLLLPITDAVEPNEERRKKARKRASQAPTDFTVNVSSGFAEDLMYRDAEFAVVSYLRGFHQCRSDVESLIEINRVLKLGGVFLLDIPTEKCAQSAFGKGYVLKHFIMWLRQFGFELLKTGPCDGELHLLAFYKASGFGPDTYLKPQLILEDEDMQCELAHPEHKFHCKDQSPRQRVRHQRVYFSVRNAGSYYWWMDKDSANRMFRVELAVAEKDLPGSEVPSVVSVLKSNVDRIPWYLL